MGAVSSREVTRIAVNMRTRMEIDLMFRSGVSIAHEYLQAGDMENCLAILKEYGEKIDRLTDNLIGFEELGLQRKNLPLHRDWANHGVSCSTCDDGGCPDCTDPTY